MKIELTSGALSESGKEVYLTVDMRDGVKHETRSFTIPRAIFEGLGLPTPPAEITTENVYELLEADEQYRAIKKAFDILAYGRNSVKTLVDKLRHRGFSGHSRYLRVAAISVRRVSGSAMNGRRNILPKLPISMAHIRYGTRWHAQ